jgi:hypothetical protein
LSGERALAAEDADRHGKVPPEIFQRLDTLKNVSGRESKLLRIKS